MDNSSISLASPPRPIWETLFSLSPGVSFGLACIIGFISIFLQQEILMTEELFYNSLGEQMAYERIEALVLQQQKYKWLSYLIAPIALLMQILLITLCLNVGTILFEYKVGFRKLFGMVIRATAILAVISTIQIIPLLLVDIQTIDQLVQLDWFSLAALFQGADLPTWLLLPLKMINLVTLFTLCVLAGGMHWLTRRPYGQTLGFVTSTYGTGILLLVLFIIFLQLNMS
jgi:hypothetical protein